ncbi:LptF/LptG family permease, partial [Candidatus Latescibacterota bacterium]
MRIITRYVLEEFWTFLMFSVLAFIAIFVLVDAVEVLDTFIDERIGAHLIVLYYFFYLPYIIVLTIPVAMLLTTMFSLGRLVSDNEIIAMKSSGVSLYRILLPLYVFSLVVGMVVMLFTEYVVPNTNRYRQDIETQGNEFRFTLLRERELDQAYVFVANGDSSVIYARDYSSRKRLAAEVFYVEPYTFTEENAENQTVSYLGVRRRIDAEYMYYEDGQWVMVNAVERRFTGDGEDMTRYEILPAPFIIVEPPGFARIDIRPEEMNYFQLRDYISSIQSKGGDAHELIVDLYLKMKKFSIAPEK